MTTRAWLGALAAVALIAAALLWRQKISPPLTGAPAGAGIPAASHMQALETGVGSEGEANQRSIRAATAATSATALLTVLLEDGGGQPVAGTVFVATGTAADTCATSGPVPVWQRHVPRGSGNNEEHQAPSGRAAAPVPMHQRLWIRAAPLANPRAGVYRRLEGIARDTELRLCLADDAPRHVHVLVYDAALEGPEAGAEVELRSRAGEAPQWRGRTDATGYVLATAPSQGLVTVQVAGAPADDEDARAVVQMEATAGEPVVVLAAAEPCLPCTFVLESGLPVAAGAAPPAVILQRVEPGRHCVRLLTPALVSGRSEHRVDLPYGTFAVTPLPQGCAEIAAGADLVEVAAEGKGVFHVRLEPGPTRSLQLAGLTDTDFPVQLRLCADDAVLDTAEDRIWLGPARWRRRCEQVPGWTGPARLVARGRGAAWISATAVSAGVPVVPMQPAAEVEVLAPTGRGRGLVAEVVFAGGTYARVLRSTMVATQRGKQPFLRAILFAPAGPVTIVLRSMEGIEVWREIRQAHGRVLVEAP